MRRLSTKGIAAIAVICVKSQNAIENCAADIKKYSYFRIRKAETSKNNKS